MRAGSTQKRGEGIGAACFPRAPGPIQTDTFTYHLPIEQVGTITYQKSDFSQHSRPHSQHITTVHSRFSASEPAQFRINARTLIFADIIGLNDIYIL